MADQHDAVARGDAEHRDEPDERAERQHAAREERRRHAADQRERQRQRDQRDEPRRAEVDVQHQQDPEQRQQRRARAAGSATPRAPRTRRGPRRGTPPGTCTLASAASMSRATAPRSRPRTLVVTSMRRDPPSRVISFGVGASATSATASSGTYPPPGGVDRQPLDGEQVGAHRRHAPDDDVEDLLLLVDLADLRAAQQRRQRLAHLPGRHARDLRRLRPHPHLDLRHERQLLDRQVGDAVDAGQRCARLRRPSCRSSVEIRTEDAHDDRGAGAGQHFLDALAQIGQQVARQAGIAVDDRLDLRDRRRRSRPTDRG